MSRPLFGPATSCPINEKRTPGFCKLLFETPSGFAIFSFNKRFLHFDIEDTWLYFVGDHKHYSVLMMHVFRRFEDKSDAINLTTRQLGGRMIALLCKYCLPGELIIVGRPEYKSIIQEKLRRPCLCNDIVREIMWGIQNLMPLLIPQEQSKFTKADRLPICKGLDMLLSQHGINNVKQEWINEDILQTAVKVYHADLREKEHSKFLRRILGLDKHLKDISGFDAKDWDLVKLATALKTMVDPSGIPRLTLGEAFDMFLDEEVKLILHDAPKYEDLLDRDTILKIYDDIVALRDYVDKLLLKLRDLLKKAEAAETEDVLEQVDPAVDVVLVPNGSSIAEGQQRHITSGAIGEEVIATNKDTPAVSTIQDVAQHAKTRAQVKNGGMHTNNGDGGERAEATDLSRGMHTKNAEVASQSSIDEDEDQQHITGADGTLPSQMTNEPGTSVEGTNQENEAEKASLGDQRNTILVSVNNPSSEEVVATSKDTPAVCTTQDVAQHANTRAQECKTSGGEQAEVTDLSKSVKMTSAEKNPGEGGKQAEPNRTGLHAEQSKDKKTSAKVASPTKKVASPTKQVRVDGTVQNNDDGRKLHDTLSSLLSDELSIESSEQSQTRRSESMTLDTMSKSSKAVFGWSGPLVAPQSSHSFPVFQPRSTHQPPLAAEGKKTTKDAVKAGSKDKKTSNKDARSSVKAVPPETSSADPEATRPDPEAVPSQGYHFVKKTFNLLKKQP